MATSLRSLAREAGVSPSTVSRFLRGELEVSPETEHKIQKAMKALAWSSPQVSKPLDNVAIILPGFFNVYFVSLAEALVHAAYGHKISTSVHVTGGRAASEIEMLHRLDADRNIHGIICVADNAIGEVQDLGIATPLVFLDEPAAVAGAAHIGSVAADNENGAYQAVAHLLSRGHRHIAFLAGPEDLPSTAARELGYRKALHDAGLDADTQVIFRGPHSEAFGASVLSQIATAIPQPTAIFASSDIMAIGIYRAAEQLGYRIPDDFSVVGFDGIYLCDWLTPQLTSVEQPVADLARTAFSVLREVHQQTAGRSVTLPMQLRPRASVATITPAN